MTPNEYTENTLSSHNSFNLSEATLTTKVREFGDNVVIELDTADSRFSTNDVLYAFSHLTIQLNPQQAGELFNALFNFLSPYDVTPKFDEVNA